MPHIREFTVNVSGYTDLGDMQLVAGDTDESGTIDFVDVAYLRDSYSLYIGDYLYTPKYDLNLDGGVDFIDVGILAENYGLDVAAYGDYIDYN